MSEKQFDIFDDHFKNAAENYEPEFSEAAWQKMQVKLDEKEKRRRFAGWWWWASDALMVSLLLYMAISLNSNEVATEKNSPKIENGQTSKKAIEGKENPGSSEDENKTTTTATQTTIETKKGSTSFEKQVTVAKPKNNHEAIYNTTKTNLVKNSNTTHSPSLEINFNSKNTNTGNSGTQPKTVENSTTEQSNYAGINNNNPLIAPNSSTVTAVKPTENKSIVDSPETVLQKPVLNIDSAAPIVAEKTKTRKNIPLKKGFFLHAAIAPEKSYVKGNDFGPLNWTYGGGVGFSFAKRWNVMAGLYTSKKVYTAGGDDYFPKSNSYYYNLKIYSVDAVCRITEIPLSVNYAVLQKPRHNIVAGVGFASLIMKKEWYDYHFERANGLYGRADYTYKTNNVHLFAAALLTAGYQYNINKRLSVTASPYVKLPLYGVGEGRVKISSAGISTGVIYKLPAFGKKQR
ncbi:MAG: hypothetical protein V4717_12845 [Bacteroidota bacterium]